jgi:ankyrin repeat protein
MLAAHDAAKVRLLLARGADPKFRAPSGVDALTVAAGFRGNTETVRMLIDAGALPNPPEGIRLRNSPLVSACMHGDVDMVRLLLARGADPNFTSRSNSPVSAAITFNRPEALDLLLKAGADATGVDGTGVNLLHWATITDRPETIPLLARAGVDLNAVDDNGFTPLMYAASIDFDDTRAIEALLTAGAKTSEKDFDNRIALDHARRLRHTRQIRLLDPSKPSKPTR